MRQERVTSQGLIYYEDEEELEYVSYHHEMLSAMTISDLFEYMGPYKKKVNILSKRVLNWWEIKKQNDLETAQRIVRQFEYEISTRNNKSSNKVDLRKKLSEVPLSLVMQKLGVSVTKSKKFNMKCPLPNHKDSTPSFRIYEHKNDWFCFGCQCGGNAIDFIREYKQIENRMAVKDFINNF